MPHFALGCPCSPVYGAGPTKYDLSDGTNIWGTFYPSLYEQFDVDRKSGLIWQLTMANSAAANPELVLRDLNGAGGIIWNDTETPPAGGAWLPYGLRTCHALNYALLVIGNGSAVQLYNTHTRVYTVDYTTQTPSLVANVTTPFGDPAGFLHPAGGHDILGVVQDVRGSQYIYLFLRGYNNAQTALKNRIYRYHSDMTSPTVIYEETAITNSLLWSQSWLDLDYHNDRLVFIDNFWSGGNPAIKACNLDGSGVTSILTRATSTSYIASMQVNHADSTIYYFPYGSGNVTSLRSVGLDGSNDGELFTFPSNAYCLWRIGESFPYDDTYP